MPQTDSPAIFALVSDLMFSSRIAAEARAAGVGFKITRNPADLCAIVAPFPKLILIDLNSTGAVDVLSQLEKTLLSRVVGFVSHTDSATIAKAKQAGIGQVLPRSAFVQQLPALIQRQPARPE